MKTGFCLALLLLLAGAVRADAVGTESGILYIPSGVTITSETTTIDFNGGILPLTQIDFTFAGGSGFIAGGLEIGEGGELDFDTPLSSITFDWGGFPFSASDNTGDSFSGVQPDGEIFTSGTVTFSTPGITKVTFGSDDDTGGIMDFTAVGQPVPAPEPAAYSLLAIGLAGLLALKRRTA